MLADSRFRLRLRENRLNVPRPRAYSDEPTRQAGLDRAHFVEGQDRNQVALLSEAIDATLVCTALKSAWWLRKPPKGLLVHSDRGAQYASGRYRALSTELEITISISRKGNAWNIAPMESFFETLKVERIYRVRYDTRAQPRLDIVDWIEGRYNSQRLHSATGFLAPVTRENAQLAA